MYIFLPNDVEGLDDLEDDLDAEKINEALERMYSTKVDVMIPKFKITHLLELKETLEKLGEYS